MKKVSVIFISLFIMGIMIPASLDAQVVVKGNKAWTKTKISVAKNDKVQVQVTGTVTLDPNVTCTADGLKISSGPEHIAIKNVNRGALVAKVGKNGAPFLIGASGQFIVGPEGKLMFGINDDNVKNNTGAFTLTVTVNGTAK
jgi:hypothetical protein